MEIAKLDPERWLAFPPLYQQILGSWLRFSGISTAAMLGFVTALNIGMAAALLGILRRLQAHWGWSIPPLLMIYIAEVHDWGMRPEATGMLLLLCGILFLLRRDRTGAFCAGVCLIGSGLVLQQAGIYSGLIFLAGLWQIAGSPAPPGQRWLRAAFMLAGGLVPIFFFLMGIGWDLPGFLHAYHKTLVVAAGAAATRTTVIAGYWFWATMGWGRGSGSSEWSRWQPWRSLGYIKSALP